MKAFISMWRMDLRIRPYVIRLGFYGIYRIFHCGAGSLLLHVEGENQTLNGSPLPFKVNPGDALQL